MKDKVYRCCVRSAIGLLHGSETWCLKENKKSNFKENKESYGESHVRSESY